MAEKPYTGGAASMRKRGLRGLLVPLTTEQYDRVAANATAFGRRLGEYAAESLDAKALADEKRIRKKTGKTA